MRGNLAHEARHPPCRHAALTFLRVLAAEPGFSRPRATRQSRTNQRSPNRRSSTCSSMKTRYGLLCDRMSTFPIADLQSRAVAVRETSCSFQACFSWLRAASAAMRPAAAKNPQKCQDREEGKIKCAPRLCQRPSSTHDCRHRQKRDLP